MMRRYKNIDNIILLNVISVVSFVKFPPVLADFPLDIVVSLLSAFLQLCCLGGDGARSMWLYVMKECLPVLRNVLHSCIGRLGTAFIVLIILFLRGQLICWLYLRLCLPLLAGLSAWRFTVNHREKPGPLPWPLFKWFHGLSSCFCRIAWGQAGLILGAFCFGHVTRPTALHTPSMAAEIFC